MKIHRIHLMLFCCSLVTLLAGCAGDHGHGEAPEHPDTTSGAAASSTDVAGETPAGANDAALPDEVRKAVAVAREIEADPDATAAILERHDLTPEDLDDLMYRISSDPVLAEQYRRALE